MLWEWAYADVLWVLVLAKGVLTMQRPELNPFASPGATAVACPAELETLQAEVATAVRGLARPDVLFAGEAAGQDGGAVPIAERTAELVLHRARLATELCRCQLLWPLLTATTAAGQPSAAEELAAFLVALLQPEASASCDTAPAWATEAVRGGEALAAARAGAAELRSSLSWFATELWKEFASAAEAAVAEGRMVPRGLLLDCGALVACGVVIGPDVLRLCEMSVAGGFSEGEAAAVASVCLLLAALATAPEGATDVAAALAALSPGLGAAAAERCAARRGAVQPEALSPWLRLLLGAGGSGSASGLAAAAAAEAARASCAGDFRSLSTDFWSGLNSRFACGSAEAEWAVQVGRCGQPRVGLAKASLYSLFRGPAGSLWSICWTAFVLCWTTPVTAARTARLGSGLNRRGSGQLRRRAVKACRRPLAVSP